MNINSQLKLWLPALNEDFLYTCFLELLNRGGEETLKAMEEEVAINLLEMIDKD